MLALTESSGTTKTLSIWKKKLFLQKKKKKKKNKFTHSRNVRVSSMGQIFSRKVKPYEKAIPYQLKSEKRLNKLLELSKLSETRHLFGFL